MGKRDSNLREKVDIGSFDLYFYIFIIVIVIIIIIIITYSARSNILYDTVCYILYSNLRFETSKNDFWGCAGSGFLIFCVTYDIYGS